jgi:hypothetical protein
MLIGGENEKGSFIIHFFFVATVFWVRNKGVCETRDREVL